MKVGGTFGEPSRAKSHGSARGLYDPSLVIDLAAVIESLRSLTGDDLVGRGFTVEGSFDAVDDPVLIGPDGETVETAEVDARIAADVRWIDGIFTAAERNKSGAVVLMMQAEPSLGPIDNDRVYGTEFVAIHDRIFALADAHPNMQVVIAHGDQHNHLWEPGYGGAAHPNVARLENWGSNTDGVLAVTRWQKVTVTCGEDRTPATFRVVDQVVPAA